MSPAPQIVKQNALEAGAEAGHRKLLIVCAVVALVLLCVAGAWRFTSLHEVADPERLAGWLKAFKAEPWMPVVIVLVYLLGSLVFFPNTVLNTATILGLGTRWGLPCALMGSLVAAMAAFYMGRRYGSGRLRHVDSDSLKKVTSMLEQAGIFKIALLRLLPIAPYGVVNLIAGAARVKAFSFALGTLLGLLPGSLLVTAFGHQLKVFLQHPKPTQIAIMLALLLAAAIAAWWTRRRALECTG